MGGRFGNLEDNREIPDTLEVVWQYPGGTLVTFSQFNASAAPWSLPGCEIEIRGTLGTLYLFGDGYQVVPDAITPNVFPARSPLRRREDNQYRQGSQARIEARENRSSSTSDTTHHARNFLDCVKDRRQPNCPIETAHRSTSTTQLGNVALAAGALLEWDPSAERITNVPQADLLLDYHYRPPYQLPEG